MTKTPCKFQVSTGICAQPSNRPMRPLPKSAPPDHKLSGTLSNVSAETDANYPNFHLAKEMKGHFVGAMPPLVFIDKFLQKPIGLQEHPQNEAPWARVSSGFGRYESLMPYEPFVSRSCQSFRRIDFLTEILLCRSRLWQLLHPK